VTEQFGVIWGGDNDVSNSWSERMEIWIEESIQRGRSTGVMDDKIEQIANILYVEYLPYFDSVKPRMVATSVAKHQQEQKNLIAWAPE
jgi:hypothetical protein